ncbi:PAS domain S-box protein [Pontiella sulfatireligans]|uniref:histidine kinase n=1 Tax=Pontiella sulfatireligans TaxID=2750658 RepID=A0A6C2UQ15_9BACT|nr:PAS domain S-box protein [Pontiella sulfatireligans]VGO22298.1 Sensor kinase CckA [Pontiella sulfatireligans]
MTEPPNSGLEPEEYFQGIFNASDDAIFIQDVETGRRFLDMNDRAMRMYGITREKLPTFHIRDLSDGVEPYSQKDADEWNRKAKEEGPQTFEWIGRNAKGSTFPLEVYLRVAQIGKQKLLISTVRNITERKKTQRTLEESQRKFQALLSNLPGMAYRCSNEYSWRMDFVSQGSVELTGYAPDEIVKSAAVAYEDIVHPEDRDQLWTNIQTALESRNPFEQEYRIITKGGAIKWVWERGSGHYSEQNELLFLEGFITDISDRKRLQDSIEQRIIALTQPLEGAGNIDFDNLFSLEQIQRLQDHFSSATGVASIITHPDGTPITEPSNFTRLCHEIIRKSEIGRANCFKSDSVLRRSFPQGPMVRPCLSCGLWEAGTRIMVGGRHIANWLIGQVRDETQPEEHIRAYARKIDADEEAFMEAYAEVPVMSSDRFSQVAKALDTLTNQLSTSAYQNIQQARFIAQQHKAEKKLQELTNIQSLILNNNSLGIALVDQRRFKWVNPRLGELLGIPAELLRGTPVRMLYPSDQSYSENGKIIYDELGKGLRVDRALELQHQDGTPFWGRLIGKALNPAKPQEGSLWMLEDITERRESEMELTRLSTVITQSPEAVIITELDGTIQYINPAFEAVSGYSREEALGQKPSILKSGKQSPSLYAALWGTIEAGRIWEGRFVNRRKDGSHYTEEATISPVKDAEGRITNYVAVKRDITEELIHDEELRQAQKMEAVGQLAGGIAHDFNNILQGILGFSEMLISDTKKRSQQHDNACEIRKSAKRAAELTQQLLAFSRKQSTQFTRLDLNNTIHDSTALLDILLRKKYKLVLDLQEGLPPVHADQGQLSQVIMNLAVNARDAMEEGGRLTISTAFVELNEKDAGFIRGANSGAFVCVSFTDTGCGMDDDVINRLFEPFFTTKEVGSGTGLGLAVVYGIIKQSKGWINVYSEKGTGCCVKVYLPALINPQPLGEDQPLAREADNTRILLVDDDPDICRMVSEILNTAGYRSVAASSAEDALEIFEKEGGRFDMLMSDMMLPVMSGDGLADALRKANPDLPVLLFSGYCDQKERWQHLDQNSYHFTPKPFTVKRLLETVHQIINTPD